VARAPVRPRYVELFESAVKMGRAALTEAGIDPREIDRVEREYRLRDCERLERQTATGDIRAGLERSFGPDQALPDEQPGQAAQAPAELSK